MEDNNTQDKENQTEEKSSGIVEGLENKENAIDNDFRKKGEQISVEDMNSTLESLSKEYAERTEKILTDPSNKLKMYLKSKDMPYDTKLENLTPEQKKELDAYKFTQDDKDILFAGLYQEAKKKFIAMNEKRKTKLFDIGRRMDNLKEETQNAIAECKQKLAEAKTNKEKNKIQSEIDRLQAVLDKLNSKEKGSLHADYAYANSTQPTIRETSYTKLQDIFGKNLTKNDRGDFVEEKSKDKEGQDKVEEKAENTKEKDKQEKQQEGEKQGKTSQQPARAQSGEQAGNMQYSPNAGMAGSIGKEDLSNIPLTALLGINADNALNYNSSWDILGNFASPSITDAKRIEMLNDPDCKKYIINALNITSSNLNPFRGREYSSVRNEILRLSKGPLKEMALRQYGIENPENVNKEFKKLLKEFKAKYNEAKTDEERRAVQEKYDTIINISDFSKGSSRLNTIGTRFNDFKNAVLNKKTYKELAKSSKEASEKFAGWMFKDEDKAEDKSKNENSKEVSKNITDNEKAPNNFRSSLTKQVVSEEKVAAKDLERSKDEKSKQKDQPSKENKAR